jgi:2'-5' RNA ligase
MPRCFIAVDLDQKVKDELKKIQQELEACNRGKIKANFVNPDILHLTLLFLGEIDDARVNKVKEVLKTMKIEKVDARLNGLGIFPSQDFIRVIWVGLQPNEKFLQIHETIKAQLERENIKVKQEKFESHVTLARIKWLKDKNEFLNCLKKIEVQPLNFTVDTIKLKKSTLTREGPIYEDIFSLQLL